MKNLLLTFCLAVCTFILNAQIASVMPALPKQSYGFKSRINNNVQITDIVKFGPHNNSTTNQPANCPANVDNMPVAGLGQVNLTPLGNNQQGFDLYNAAPDNMTVAKPDSTFYSTMPNAFVAPAKPWFKH